MNRTHPVPQTNPVPAPKRFTRREAVKLAAVGFVGGALGASGAALITRLAHAAPSHFGYFSEEEAAALGAVCEQLIPRDDAPGATDAGVIHFIDRQLGGRLARYRSTYQRGLAALQQTCRAEFGRPFAALDAHRQIDVLRRLESGEVPKESWTDPSGPQFFRLVLAHTMQGFYGPPRHGGNRGYVSYRMLGVDYPQIIGQNRPGKERA